MKQQNLPKAFSLIELSVVILIVGILVAGVTQSSSLVRKFRLESAKSLTRNSSAATIKDLLIWYETSLDESFLSSEAQDGKEISIWKNINPQQINKPNATQTTLASRPKYTEGVFDSGIPSVRFNGTNNFMNFDGSGLAGTPYTIFIVAQRTDSDNPSGSGNFIGGSGSSANGNLGIAHSAAGIIWAHWGNNLAWNSPTGVRPLQNIYTFQLNTSVGKMVWLNGGGSTPDFSAAQTKTLVSFSGAMIGHRRSATQRFKGDLAEIIIYTRSLMAEERQEVEKYLSKKYNIQLN